MKGKKLWDQISIFSRLLTSHITVGGEMEEAYDYRD